MKSRGFSLIELLIVVSILGILTALVSVNASQNRAKARDANRISTVKQYQGAMQLNRSANGSYYVFRPINLTIDQVAAAAPYQFDELGRPYVSESIRLSMPTILVGYRGAGWGRMLAAGTESGNYSQQYSIVEALIFQGYLSQLKFDSRMSGPQDIRGDETNLPAFNDYNLALCNQYGQPPQNPRDAATFGIYVQLELPQAFPESSQAKSYCGGAGSPTGWNTITTN